MALGHTLCSSTKWHNGSLWVGWGWQPVARGLTVARNSGRATPRLKLTKRPLLSPGLLVGASVLVVAEGSYHLLSHLLPVALLPTGSIRRTAEAARLSVT